MPVVSGGEVAEKAPAGFAVVSAIVTHAPATRCCTLTGAPAAPPRSVPRSRTLRPTSTGPGAARLTGETVTVPRM